MRPSSASVQGHDTGADAGKRHAGFVTNDEPTAWCPNCGAEFRAGFAVCTDCGVAVVDTKPPEPDHTEATVEVGGWDEEQREGMELRLVTAGVPHRWEGELLVIPHASVPEVRQMIDAVERVGDPEPAVVITGDPTIGEIRFGFALVVAGALKVIGVVAAVASAVAAVWFYAQYPDEFPGRVVQPVLTVV